ncbi:hypothetical protein JCM10207_000671 [Rhodosporidiobolus poonsookiae]
MILDDDNGNSPVPRRRTPPVASFPPHPTSSFASLPSSRSDLYLPYALRRAAPHSFEHEYDDESGVGYPTQGGRLYSGAGANGALATVAAWRHQRGSKAKLLMGLAGVAIVYLLYDSLSRRHHGPPHWRHGHPPFPPPPPPPGFEPQAPDLAYPKVNDPHKGVFAGQPPPTTTSAGEEYPTQIAVPKLETAELPLADIKKFIQPRRAVPPTWPDPWASVEDAAFKGREYLSVERFGSDETGWKKVPDPPAHDPPPARWLLKAFEYAAAVAGRNADGSPMVMRPGMAFDERTGRPKKVAHEELKLGRESGWRPKKGYKVDELGTGKQGERDMPRVQFEGEPEGGELRATEEKRRREWVKRAFQHAWAGYSKYAYGHDEVSPVSNRWANGFNGWGATLVDSLDTLLIMNMSHEYNIAREHVAQIDFSYLAPSGSQTFSTDLPSLEELDIPPPGEVREPAKPPPRDFRQLAAHDQRSPRAMSWFETLIRYLGSLLAAFELSGDPLMLERAQELGDWLLPAMATKSGLAYTRYSPGLNPDGQPGGRVVLAEVGSCILEMTKLSQLTGNRIYFEAAQRALDTLETNFAKAAPPPPGNGKNPLFRGRLGTLLPTSVDPAYPSMMQGTYSMGGEIDSYYEYLIKQAQLTSFSHEQYPRMYEAAVESAYEFLIRRVEVVPGREDLTLIGKVEWGTFTPEMQHLTCFAGGMLGLGAKLLDRPYDLETGINVTETCAWIYESSETGVGNELTTFYGPNDPSRYVAVDEPNGPGKVRAPRGAPYGVRSANRRQIGRPETIESVFYMYRITGDRYWQDVGWTMFVNWVEHAITEAGFATVRNVNSPSPGKDDSMESFVLGETLKYYYLLFSPPDFMSLDDWVFTTEAHPFWIPKPSAPRPPSSFWSGPDENAPPSAAFVDQMGEGTWVQKWARVQQAAALAGYAHKGKVAPPPPMPPPPGQAGAGAGGEGGRQFVRPNEDQIAAAHAAAREKVAPIDMGAPAVPGDWGQEGGGGRGMGGRPA